MTDATLHLKVNATEVDKGAKSLDQLAQSGGKAEAASTALTKATDILANAAKVAAGAFGAFKLIQYAREATMLAARFETMGIVMKVAGNNAGYTSAQMDKYSVALQKNGISMLQSRDALTQLATANIDLAKASAIGRAAQDLAVVGNVNSSEAMNRMIHGIKSGQVEVLRTLGLNVSFEESYKKLAKELGKNVDVLTGQEKALARTNAVLDEAKNYAGIYEESMTTAGKAMSSLTRHSENLQVKIGEIFLPALADAVFTYTEALKSANTEMDKMGSSGNIDQIGRGLAGAFRVVYETVMVVGATIASTFDIIGRGIGGFAAQVNAILHGNFSEVSIIQQQIIADNIAANAALDAFNKRILEHGDVVKTVSKYDEDAAIKRGEASRKQAALDDKAATVADKAAKASIKAIEELRKARESWIDGLIKSASEIDSETASLIKKTEQLRLETAEIGKTAQEIEVLRMTRYDHVTQIEIERLAVLDAANACTAESEALRDNIKARQEQRGAMVDNAGRKAEQVAIDAEKKATIDMWKSIDQTAHDTFVSIANGGKNTAQRLKETFKNTFFDWLYSMTLKKWLINVSGGAIGGMGAGSAMAGIGGDGGAGSWLSTGKNLMSVMQSSFTEMSASFTSLAGNISGGLQAIGVEAGTAGSIGVAGAYAGAGLAGIGLGTMIAGDKVALGMDGKTASIVGTAIGLAIGGPIGGVIGGALGGAFNAAFGMGPKQSGTTSLVGTASQTGFAGSYQTPWSQKGGWFRSNKSGVDVQGIGAEQAQAFQNVIAGTEFVFAKLAAVSGEATTALDTWSFAINRQVATQEQQNQLVIDIANSMGAHMIPRLSQFQKEGENLADTSVRLSDEVILLNKLFYALGSTSRATIDSADQLANALGGVANSAQLMTSFISGFAPEARQSALTLEALTNAGLPMAEFLTTTEAWWAFAQTASTEQLTAILANQGAIKSWVDAMDKSSQAVKDNIKALQDKAVADFKAASDAVASLRTFGASVRDLMRSLWLGAQSPLSSTYGASRSEFVSTNIAAAGGNVAAQGNLAGSATQFLDAARLQATSAIEYTRDFAMVQNALGATADATDVAVSVADKQLLELQQVNLWLAEIDLKNGVQNTSLEYLLGAAVASNQAAADAVNTQIAADAQKAADAQAAIVAANAAAEAARIAAETAAAAARVSELAAFRANVPTTYIGGQTNNPYWEKVLADFNAAHQAAYGIPMNRAWGGDVDAQRAYSALSAQYQASIPAFAIGTNSVPFDMTAQIHAGEEITPRPYVDMQRTAREETNALLTRLVASNDEMKGELKAAKIELADIKRTNQNMDWTSDKWDNDGTPPVRT